MKVPTAKDKVVKSCRLRSIDGVRDMKLGRASVEDRFVGRAGVVPHKEPDVEYSDEKARAERYGQLPF